MDRFSATHAAIKTRVQYDDMWKKLVGACDMRIEPPRYEGLAAAARLPQDGSGSVGDETSEKGRRIQDAIGAFYDGNAAKAWFVHRAIKF